MGNWLEALTSRLHVGAGSADAETEARHLRASLGLEQFLPQLAEVEHPSVLDLGCVWQANVSFFTRRGCKTYTEDLFQMLVEMEGERKPDAPPLAERFLGAALNYPPQTFRGVLAWDLFDYLPEELLEPVAARLHELLEPRGALLLLCHKRADAVLFRRYRIADDHQLELVPGSLPLELQRAFENRPLLNLFSAFDSSRHFIGRDNLRELFVVK